MKRKTKDPVTKEIGSIELNGRVYVTDPCYHNDTWCQEYLDNVLQGTYRCFVKINDEEDWGDRVAELHVVEKNVLRKYNGDIYSLPYEDEPYSEHIGVDSGQCGIFDADYFENNREDCFYKDGHWYKKICDASTYGGIVDGSCAVSDSGFGDGMYNLYVIEESGNIVAMKIVFIP